MRHLTITRRKTFVASLSTAKVYVADNSGVNDLTIEGLPCRFLGKIKNGKTAQFEIGNEAVRVYVVFGKLSANYCNDVYIVPEGEEDLFLSGICEFNPVTGNAFRFDGTPHPETVANRNKSTKVGIIVLVVAVVVGFIIGFFIAFI